LSVAPDTVPDICASLLVLLGFMTDMPMKIPNANTIITPIAIPIVMVFFN
jgi:hypothetical protein